MSGLKSHVSASNGLLYSEAKACGKLPLPEPGLLLVIGSVGRVLFPEAHVEGDALYNYWLLIIYMCVYISIIAQHIYSSSLAFCFCNWIDLDGCQWSCKGIWLFEISVLIYTLMQTLFLEVKKTMRWIIKWYFKIYSTNF